MTRIFDKVAFAFQDTPVLMAAMVINVIVFTGFWFTLGKIGDAASRRDAMLEKCIATIVK
jgi:hypothetical protein